MSVAPPVNSQQPPAPPFDAAARVDEILAGLPAGRPPGAVPPVIDAADEHGVVDFSGFAPGTPGAGIVVKAGESGLEFRPGIDTPVGAILEHVKKVIGSGGDDEIEVDDSVTEVDGGAGDDTYVGMAGRKGDTGGGFDTVDLSKHARGLDVDFVAGKISDGLAHTDMAGIERVIVTRFGDFVVGGDGDDTIVDRGGADVIRGGLGRNALVYEPGEGDTAVGVIANLKSGWILDHTGAADQVENIQDLITGRASDFVLGDARDNRFEGGAGNDFLIGGRGRDALNGGDGDDTLIGSDFEADGGSDTDDMDGGAGDDMIFAGNGAAARMRGGAGDDAMWGGAADDRIEAGSGRDVVAGMSGIDHFAFSEAMKAGDFTYIADFQENAWSASGAGDVIELAKSLKDQITIMDVDGGAWIGIQIAGDTPGWYGITVAYTNAKDVADQILFV